MPALTYQKGGLKVADELFLIVALLHRELPNRDAFTIGEVLKRAATEGLGAGRADQRSLKLHAYQHAAANEPPGKGGKYRLVYRESDNRIRLLTASDYVHPDRHQKFYPEPDEVPEKYHELLEWAKQRRAEQGKQDARWLQGLFELRGLGKEMWGDADPDQYVSGLREGWE